MSPFIRPLVRATRALGAPLVIAGALAAQSSWIVDQSGAGHFTTLAQAYAAASPGDLVVVRSGYYYGAAVASVGVTVLCDASVQFDVSFAEFGVRDLPAGQTFAMRGGQVARMPHFPSDFVVDRCAGAVHFDRVDASSIAITGASTIRDVAHVTLQRCEFADLSVERATIALADCRITGQSGPALRAASTSLSISGGIVHGRLGTAALELAGGCTVDLAGPAMIDGSPAVLGTSTDHLRHAASVQFRAPSPPVIRTTGSVTPLGLPAVSSDSDRANGVLSIVVSAEPGSLTAVFADTPVAPILRWPLGSLWVRPTAPVVDLRLVLANGAYTLTVSVPRVPPAARITLQPISILAGRGLALGAPATLVFP